MAFKKRTLRTMSPTARKVARLIGEQESVAKRLKNLIPALQQLDADSKALATAKGTPVWLDTQALQRLDADSKALATAKGTPVWLDTNVLTEALTDELKDSGIEVSTDNLMKLWDNFVATELHEGLRGCLKFSPAFEEYR